MNKIKNGFTLLELLVVVVIIAIFAAIALPQYKKAVWKSRAAELYTNINAVGSAIQRYYLVHNTWAHDFDDLDIDIPIESIEGTACRLQDKGGKSLKQSKNFALKVQPYPHNAAYAVFTNGPYKCGGFAYYTGANPSGTELLCAEITSEGAFVGERGDFCEKVMGYSFYSRKGGVDWFTKN